MTQAVAIIGYCVAAYAVWSAWDFGRRWIGHRLSQTRSDARLDAIEAKQDELKKNTDQAFRNLAKEMQRVIGVVDENEQPIAARVRRLEQDKSNTAMAQGHMRLRR